jgi:hypothetical protein
VDSVSAPYGFSYTSFRVTQQVSHSTKTGRGSDSVHALAALAVLRSISSELQNRGYEVTSPGLARNTAIASFTCTLPLVRVDIFLTAGEPDGDWIDCKLSPLGWRRTWKAPDYQEIWREWEQLRLVIDEHLPKAFNTESLHWVRPPQL